MENDLNTIKKMLPGLLGEMARRGFVKEAITLGKGWGGSKRYIPGNPEGSKLASLIGTAAARFICHLYGGEQVDIPTLKSLTYQKLNIIDHSGGTRRCAQDVGCTERWVRKVRSELGYIPLARRQRLDTE
jgi:hypothetical protein